MTLGALACSRAADPELAPDGAAASVTPAAVSVSQPPKPPIDAATVAPEPEPDAKRYPWLGNADLKRPEVSEALSARFPPPPSYQRVPVAEGSFGAWLRGLPLAPPGTPVVNHKGEEVVSGDDQYLGAVIALDVGTNDLQTSTDVLLRLDAEWRFSAGLPLDYRAATGLSMPFERWLRGDRLKPMGAAVVWIRNARPAEPSHAALRAYLDAVYTWANSTSLLAQSTVVPVAEMRPGDFLMHPGKPNHAVLLLDLAKNPSGEWVALLGRGLNPAQSFHVLRLGGSQTWFSLDPSAETLLTPGTDPFPWEQLRRLP